MIRWADMSNERRVPTILLERHTCHFSCPCCRKSASTLQITVYSCISSQHNALYEFKTPAPKNALPLKSCCQPFFSCPALLYPLVICFLLKLFLLSQLRSTPDSKVALRMLPCVGEEHHESTQSSSRAEHTGCSNKRSKSRHLRHSLLYL